MFLLLAVTATGGDMSVVTNAAAFPVPLEAYDDSQISNLWDVLKHRAQVEPFNVWATVLFLVAVIHTFLTHKFRHWAHVLADRSGGSSVGARVLHFLGEVEAVFGIWVLPLFALMIFKIGWTPALEYVNHKVSYHEPLFVVVIMAIASTRPILNLAEQCLRLVANLGSGKPSAWWLAILTLGPVLGSLITEPAAMTISALLLARQFYALKPSPKFAYATLGLLFVNVSVGGVLTHFAAPPVLMVAKPWGWGTEHMFKHFGLEALVGIVISNAAYFLSFRKEFAKLTPMPANEAKAERAVPIWVTIGHVLFMAWSVLNAHHPALLIGGFLFFLAFYEVAADWQSELQLRSPILVGFFLAGLVIHGGLQSWWIAPVLGRLGELPLMLGATVLTAFNDNAAITYLATLVPNLTDGMKHAVVCGAVTGGGLTVIANAPNPAGQSILAKFFPDGISPLGLLLGALLPTAVMALCFIFLR
ncbi:MAG: hypothetical protein RLY20_3381 [Verrucomicrobiota bacterium]